MTPKISVIMAAYNAEKYLKEAIDSILNQTYTDFEFIIIDDGSIDKTASIIASYKDKRIKYHKNKKNEGLIFSLNKGLDLAHGEYIARMDADDISLEDRFEKQIAFLEENNEIGACSTNLKYINVYGQQFSKDTWKQSSLPLEWLILFQNPLAHPSMLIRNEVLRTYKLYYNKESYVAEDYDLWTRFILHSKMYVMDDILYLYRQLPQSAFHANKEISYTNSTNSNQKLIETLTGTNAPSFHIYLTAFVEKKDYPTSITNPKELIDWLNTLRDIIAKKWNWDKKTRKAVKKDYQRILANYIIKLPKRIMAKNILRFYSLGIGFYILFSKHVILFSKAKFKK